MNSLPVDVFGFNHLYAVVMCWMCVLGKRASNMVSNSSVPALPS